LRAGGAGKTPCEQQRDHRAFHGIIPPGPRVGSGNRPGIPSPTRLASAVGRRRGGERGAGTGGATVQVVTSRLTPSGPPRPTGSPTVGSRGVIGASRRACRSVGVCATAPVRYTPPPAVTTSRAMEVPRTETEADHDSSKTSLVVATHRVLDRGDVARPPGRP